MRVSDGDKIIMLVTARRLVALLEPPSPSARRDLVTDDDLSEQCDILAEFAPGYRPRAVLERAREYADALQRELTAAARPTTPKPRSAMQTIKCSRCGGVVGYATGATVTSEPAAAVCCARCSHQL